ncbi:hypothetical protein [Propionispora vibrioides]|uniref:Uncharacterized protein n=1 Tax=Propionispora vibrioides TaxID=112903 RepID=A0A1H8U3X1_9FIRM|nr:hypothetical protein [Propionispora vibrioides]SEO97970.1 hypothetical protein SAMN04490178_10824 [Propionispora vibrioides]
MKSLKEFVKALLWGPDGNPSLTSTMALVAFLSFLLVTAYLVLTDKSWAHYEVFAGVTCGGGLLTQVGGKYINNKSNF